MEIDSKTYEAILSNLTDFTESKCTKHLCQITNKKTGMTLLMHRDNEYLVISMDGLYSKDSKYYPIQAENYTINIVKAIKISVKKTPERIAKEIQKRLIDKNMDDFNATKKRVAKKEKHQSTQNKAFLDASESLGYIPNEYEESKKKGNTEIYDIQVKYKPYYDNLEVTLSDLPLPLFDKIVDLIKKELNQHS